MNVKASNPVIRISTLSGADPMTFEVGVDEGGEVTRHRVTMASATWRDLCGGTSTPEACIEAAFRFLLEREAKESILGSFDVTVISRYFPDFDRKFPEYLRR
ncbi:MAG: hypothetical protein ACREUU_06175 [Gammaproteobacteria bacterium]